MSMSAVGRAEAQKKNLVGEQITCRRGVRTVFHNLDFTCSAGVPLIVRGDNGSGKTSLLRIIAGLLDPFEGGVRWDGGPGDPSSQEVDPCEVHYLGHLNGLKSGLTVRESLVFDAALQGLGSDKLDVGLEAFNLKPLADTAVRFLSAGQKRRVALARLSVIPKQLWLLDEPSVGLDRDSTQRLWDVVAHHLSDGGFAVISSHEPVPLCDGVDMFLSPREA